MTRRKPKRKAKQASKTPDQVVFQAETEHPASPVEVQPETQQPASPVEVHVERESSPTYIELQDEFTSLASSVEEGPESETLAAPVDAPIPAEPQKPVMRSPAPAAGDRRTHPRYAFTAAVEVIAAEPPARLKTRIRDLSQQGCYVDTETPLPLGTAADVRIAKGTTSFEARARVVFNQPGKGMGLMFTAVAAVHFGTLATWITESRETSWLAANRRRSQRVVMKLPVLVCGQSDATAFFEEETHTMAISAHGALLTLMASVYRGQRVTLSNVQTKAALECVVAHIKKVSREQIQVGIEFLLPNPTFWHVAFPPNDWTPRHPHAKSGAKSPNGR
jgi:PilZ domain